MLLTQYKEAIENSNIVSKTDTDGVINFVNDEFCTISRYSREELIGQKHSIVKHPSVPVIKFQKLWEVITAKKTYKATVKNLSKDGLCYYLNTTITPILDENGKIEEYIAIREVEFKIALEEHEQRLEERVEQQTKELEMLNQTLERRVKKEIEKTNEDFSNFFNPNKKKGLFFIQDSINDALQILSKELYKEHIKINKNFINIQVEGISNELSQVIINLIQNSKDAFIMNKIKNRKIILSIFQIKINSKPFAKIVVKDNAGGINPSNIDKIFEPLSED